MEENEQNKAIQTAEQAVDTGKDVADAAKTGADLAKNASTGNVLGVAQDTFRLLSNKTFRRILLIAILLPIIIIVFLASSVFNIFDKIGDGIQTAANTIGSGAQTAGNAIAGFFTINVDGVIEISDEQVDNIIKSITDAGIDLADLKLMGEVDYTNPNVAERNKRALRQYIKKFYEIQAMTQTINSNPGLIDQFLASGKPFGAVYLYDESGKRLDKASLQQMKKWAEDKKSAVMNHFAIDNQTQDITLGYEEVIQTKEGNEIVYYLKTIKREEYQQVLASYTTPVSFLLYLEMITQNPEFVSAVVDLAQRSEIHLTVLRDTTINTTVTTSSYKIHTQTTNQGVKSEPVVNDIKDLEIENSTHQTQILKVAVTYVKTWFVEETITYNVSDSGVQAQNPFTEAQDDDEEHQVAEAEGIVTEWWKTDIINKTSESLQTITYQKGVSTGTKYVGGKKGSPGIEDSNNNNKVDNGEQVDEQTTFVGLLDNRFKIPNTSRYEAAGPNLVSGAEWLFYLMQKDYHLQNLELLMRYMLYMYTEKDYGVKELDLSMFAAREFNTISRGTNLAVYLRQFSHSGEAPQSVNGKFYKMYGDGVGWPTIGNADLQWKSHHSKFAVSGKVLENGIEKDVSNVENYVNGKLPRGARAEYTNEEVESYQIYIEKTVVDSIGEEVQSVYYNYVVNATQGLELSKQQLYALTTIAYNFGSLPTRNGYTFKSVYEAGSAKYEMNSWQHNKFIWDNWWCYLGGGASGHIPMRDAAFETYVKGVYDFSQSNAGTVFSRRYYIYYTQQQLRQFSYAPNKTITRTSANEQEIFTYVKGSSSGILDAAYQVHSIMEQEGWTYSLDGNLLGGYNIKKSLNNPNRVTCCATYVSCTLYQGGYLTESEANSFSYHSANSLYTYLKNIKKWKEIKYYGELEAGDIVFMTSPTSGSNIGHVQIYAGDGKWYNAGSTNAIRRANPYTDNVSGRFIVAIRPE